MKAKKSIAVRKETVRRAVKRELRADDQKPEGGQLTAYNLQNEQMERFLVTGEYSGLVEDYFGTEDYHEIRELVQKAKRRGGGPGRHRPGEGESGAFRHARYAELRLLCAGSMHPRNL